MEDRQGKVLDDGNTIDLPRGILTMTTLRKLPTQAPKHKTKTISTQTGKTKSISNRQSQNKKILASI